MEVVIDDIEVLNYLGNVVVLFGLIYALDLSFPNYLKYTFWFCQKIILNLDGKKGECKDTAAEN